jgi:hypothetical protein
MEIKNYINKFINEVKSSFISSSLIFIASVSIFGLLAVSIQDKYESKSLLKHSEDDTAGNFAPQGALGSIASIGGIDLSSGATDPIDYSIEVIKSRNFLRQLLTFDKVKENLVAVESYDNETGLITYNKNLFDPLKNEWAPNKKFDQNEPNYLEIHREYYIENLSLSKNRATGFLTIGFQHKSANFAKSFIDLIINELNRLTREDDLASSEKKLDFLMQKNLETFNQEVNQALSQLMENELKKIAYSSTKVDYLLEIIDPPYVPNRPFFPNRILILLLGVFLGLLLVAFTVQLRLMSRKS